MTEVIWVEDAGRYYFVDPEMLTEGYWRKAMKVKLTGIAIQTINNAPLTPYGAQIATGLNPPPSDDPPREVLIGSLYGYQEDIQRYIQLDVAMELLGEAYSLGDEYEITLRRVKK